MLANFRHRPYVKAMEFGHVEPARLAKIDLSLPPVDPRSIQTLQKLVSTGRGGRRARIGIGAPVWGVKEWLGKIYPTGTPAKDFLPVYARQFNTIELNTTYYRIPDDQTIAHWREATPASFRFCPKFPKDVSHQPPLMARWPIAAEFVRQMMKLGDRLGVSFLQMGPGFQPSGVSDLRAFLSRLPKGFQVAVEVRHPAFFENHRLIDPLFDLLQETGAHAVITDVAGRRDVLHSSIPSGRAFIRFVGNELHPSDQMRLRQWARRIKNWVDLGIEEVEFFLHEMSFGTEPELVAMLIDELNEITPGLAPHKWRPERAGEQLGLF